MEWITLISSEFDLIKLLACNTLPDLIGQDFEIQHCEGAIIGPTFLQISVVLQLVPSKSDQITDVASKEPEPSTQRPSSPISVFSELGNCGIHSWATFESLPCSPASIPSTS
ncbi:hypothetical protein FQR65_LT00729 [Abscondita terminalis]|nr:hypothetical protein FQR65_LT00729 [Abscondita terminalis]